MARQQPKRRSQSRLPKGLRRQPLPACVIEQIRHAVERDAMRWSCSRSWIVATALAAFYGINIMQPFEVKLKKRRAA